MIPYGDAPSLLRVKDRAPHTPLRRSLTLQDTIMKKSPRGKTWIRAPFPPLAVFPHTESRALSYRARRSASERSTSGSGCASGPWRRTRCFSFFMISASRRRQAST